MIREKAKIHLRALILLLASTGGLPSVLEAQTTQAPEVTDIDGNTYSTVRIGTHLWMAENLRVVHDPQGHPIESFFYQDDSVRYAPFGRLYTWTVAMIGKAEEGVQGICPDGWHLPSDADWVELFAFLGEGEASGSALLPGGATGFEATLSGGADARGNYVYAGEWAMFWGSTEASDDRAFHYGVDASGTLDKFAALKGGRIHVRCVKGPG